MTVRLGLLLLSLCVNIMVIVNTSYGGITFQNIGRGYSLSKKELSEVKTYNEMLLLINESLKGDHLLGMSQTPYLRLRSRALELGVYIPTYNPVPRGKVGKSRVKERPKRLRREIYLLYGFHAPESETEEFTILTSINFKKARHYLIKKYHHPLDVGIDSDEDLRVYTYWWNIINDSNQILAHRLIRLEAKKPFLTEREYYDREIDELIMSHVTYTNLMVPAGVGSAVTASSVPVRGTYVRMDVLNTVNGGVRDRDVDRGLFR
jgi:hypothetical protein